MKCKQINQSQKWGNLSFFPHCIFKSIIMTSLMAGKSVIVKIKIIMKFMKEIINPPCNSVLATFFELSFEVCQKRASSCLNTLVRPKWTLNQLFELLFLLPLLMSRKRKLLERERQGESCGRSRGTKWSRRCVRDRRWHAGGFGGRGWRRWCCWWRWRGWGLWVWVSGFHALGKPSSKETC